MLWENKMDGLGKQYRVILKIMIDIFKELVYNSIVNILLLNEKICRRSLG